MQALAKFTIVFILTHRTAPLSSWNTSREGRNDACWTADVKHTVNPKSLKYSLLFELIMFFGYK